MEKLTITMKHWYDDEEEVTTLSSTLDEPDFDRVFNAIIGMLIGLTFPIALIANQIVEKSEEYGKIASNEE